MTKKLFAEDSIGFVELLEVFGDDLTVVNAARVSFNKESAFEPVISQEGGEVVGYSLPERDKKLITYLAAHDHVTPFFHPLARLRIKMPIFVAREWFRHTIGFARNEVSRRYVTTEPEFFVPKELRMRDKNAKQGSRDEVVIGNGYLVPEMVNYCRDAVTYYNRLMEIEQVCPEQARMILPQSMYTEFIETASIAGYARLVALRLERTAQKEIRDYAEFVGQLLEKKFPVSWRALTAVEDKKQN